MRRIFLFAVANFFLQFVYAQYKIAVLDSGYKSSLRSICAVGNVIWASGSNGTVTRSVNGGKTFQWIKVKGFEQRDFRDIEAFDSTTAIIMAVAEPAIILKTSDGGKNWRIVFSDSTKGMFLDAMDFNEKGYGIVIGDPINNKIFLATTTDSGEHWHTAPQEIIADTGEAFFAASGSNIKISEPYIFVSGGIHSNIYFAGNRYSLPIIQGKESTGANSVAINSKLHKGATVGGDFAHDTVWENNCILFTIKKKKIFFSAPHTNPRGYRSCIEYISAKKLIACGTSGIDISADGGKNWQPVSSQSFHVCRKAKNSSTIFLAGANGKIAMLIQ